MTRKSSIAVPRRPDLSDEDEDRLRALGDAIEREALDSYEQFTLRHRRRVDTTRWRPIKSQDDLHVFCERDDFRKTWRHKAKHSRGPVGPMAALAMDSTMPMTFVTGTIPGTLDDALFGASFFDTPSLRVRGAYLDQTHLESDATLLAVLDAPRSDDPFNFLGVTWCSRKPPKHTSFLSRARDMVLLSGVRATTLCTGERVGIAFHHSIAHPDAPERPPTLRAQASQVTIFQQLDAGRVTLFIIDFIDLHGKMPAAIAVKQSLEALLLRGVKGCDAGVSKKLDWLLREKLRAKEKELPLQWADPDRLTSSVQYPEDEDAVSSSHCDICDVSFGSFASSCICQLCGELVCSKCVVNKSIVLDTHSVESKQFAFCVACIHNAKQRLASDIAHQQLQDLRYRSVTNAEAMRRRFSSSTSTTVGTTSFDKSRTTTLSD